MAPCACPCWSPGSLLVTSGEKHEQGIAKDALLTRHSPLILLLGCLNTTAPSHAGYDVARSAIGAGGQWLSKHLSDVALTVHERVCAHWSSSGYTPHALPGPPWKCMWVYGHGLPWPRGCLSESDHMGVWFLLSSACPRGLHLFVAISTRVSAAGRL